MNLDKQLKSVIEKVDEGLRENQPHHIMNLTEDQAEFLLEKYRRRYRVKMEKEEGAYSIHITQQKPCPRAIMPEFGNHYGGPGGMKRA